MMGKEGIEVLQMLSKEGPNAQAESHPPTMTKQLDPSLHCAVAGEDALSSGSSTKPKHDECHGDEHQDDGHEIWRKNEGLKL